MQGKLVDTCSSYTSLLFCPALLKILKTGFWMFFCPFPLKPSQRELILLSCRMLLQQEMLGKEHITSMMLPQERPPTLCFSFFSFFLEEFETKHITKYFKINSLPLHRSHNEYVKVEQQMTGCNLLFK